MTRDRLLLIPLLLWGLAMVAPDLVRVVHPLGSFGFYANNDGVIYDVIGPFLQRTGVTGLEGGFAGRRPARPFAAALQPRGFRCCRNALAALGGLQFVLPGRTLTLDFAAGGDQPARHVTLVAEQRPSNVLIRAVLILDQLAAILVIVAAAWLVWTRPSAMSWGFFLYVNCFM